MGQKSLNGQLNLPTSRPNYGGGTTDSLVIHVDNTKMIITGDVIWRDMLGETADKAYPGHLGKESYHKILVLTEALRQEIQRAQSAEGNLSSQIRKGIDSAGVNAETALTKVNEEIIRASSKENSLQQLITNETAKLIEAQAELLSQLNSETISREQEDLKLQAQIESILNNISSDSSDLTVLLHKEIARAKAAEESLKINLDAETRRAINQEVLLEDTFHKNIDEVKVELTEGLQSLQDQITTDGTQITSLQTQLNSMAENQIVKDQMQDTLIQNVIEKVTLQNTQLNNLSAQAEEEHSRVTDVIKDTSDLKATVLTLEDTIEDQKSSIDKVSSTIVTEIQRSTAEDEILSTQIENLNIELNKNNIKLENLSSISSEQEEKISTLMDQYKDQVEDITDILSQIELTESTLTLLNTSLTQESERSIQEDARIAEELEELNILLNKNCIQLSNIAAEAEELSNLTSTHSIEIETLTSKQEDLIDAVTTLSDEVKNSQTDSSLFESYVKEEFEKLNTLDLNHDQSIALINQNLNNLNESATSLFEITDTLNLNLGEVEEILDDFIPDAESRIATLETDLSYEIKTSRDRDTELSGNIENYKDFYNQELYKVNQLITNNVAHLQEEDQNIYNTINEQKEELLIEQENLEILIEVEVARALAAEEVLRQDIEDIINTPSPNYVHSNPPTDGTTQVYAGAYGQDIQIEASEEVIPESLVRRDTDGNILLPDMTQAESFAYNHAVPKQYIDKKDTELQEYIETQLNQILSIKFIDGGNAPIETT